MALWRGFMQYAVDLTLKVRKRLDVDPLAKLDVYHLAHSYDALVVTFDEALRNAGLPANVPPEQIGGLSGLLLPGDDQDVILVNQTHCHERITSTIGHEVAHLVLNHEPVVRLTGDDSCRSGDQDQEEEARWLGAEFLLPREAARRLVFRQIDHERAAAMYGVSVELARWRMNICGAREIQKRAR